MDKNSKIIDFKKEAEKKEREKRLIRMREIKKEILDYAESLDW